MASDSIQTFDPSQSYSVVWRQLPHWAQTGTMCFITWRTADSMPREVVERWVAERNAILLRAGLRVNDAGFGETGLHWKHLVDQLPPSARWILQGELTNRFERHLDACHGACLLRRRELAKIVADSLQKFDGDRYELTDYVVMPNHVHLLAAFRNENMLLAQCASWKRFTARQINAATSQSGAFWQEDAFDHLVRSPDQFDHYRRYIATNGSRANLPPSDYLAHSKM